MNTASSPNLPAIHLCWLLAVSASSLPLWTASAAERFPFVVPGDDASTSATDFSGLSPKGAGADGFVRVQDFGRSNISRMQDAIGSAQSFNCLLSQQAVRVGNDANDHGT